MLLVLLKTNLSCFLLQVLWICKCSVMISTQYLPLIMFMTSKFWRFPVVITDCVEWKLSWFWVPFSVFILRSSLLQAINGTRDRTCWSNPTERPGRPKFLNVFWWQLWPEGAADGAVSKWSQLKFKDGALLLNQKDAFGTEGLKKFTRIAGRSYFSWHPLLILRHPREDYCSAQNHLFFTTREFGFVFE